MITGSDELDAGLSVAGVNKTYATPAGPVPALVDVTFDAPAGSLVALAGESGSGKSTLLRAVGALERPDSGAIVLGGIDVGMLTRRERRAWRRDRLGVVLPNPAENLSERLDALGNLRWAHSLRRRRPSVGGDDQLRAELADVGLDAMGSEQRWQLSGGEQQRLAFACALAGGPMLVIADEPTASLDGDNADRIVRLARRAVDAGTTLVVATHDSRVIDVADHVVRLHGGRRVG